MFRIRELDPQRQLTKVFVVELPYPKTELSRLPNALDYRRLSEFDEQWLRPACRTLGWELVGSKTEDGSFFLYMYGATDPSLMIEKLSPFDAALGFYDDDDPDWREYGQLRELLEVAKAIPPVETALNGKPTAAPKRNARATTTIAKANVGKKSAKKITKAAKTSAKPKAKAKAKAKTKTTAKTTAKTKTKTKTKTKAKPAKRKRR